MLSDRCLSVLSVCNVGVLLPSGWMDPDKTWHAGRPRPRLHCVKWGPQLTPQKWAQQPPTFEIYRHRLCLRPYNPRPMSLVAKWLDGSRYHLVQR